MLSSNRGRVRAAVTALSLFAAPALLAAQAAPALPDANTILADYGKALGGKAAFDKLQSLHMVGTFEMPSLGVTGNVDIATARPNKTSTAVSIQNLGDILSGSDGKNSWSINPMTGPVLLSGADLAASLEDADFNQVFRDPSSFKSAQTVEKTTMDGKECYKVRIVKKSGREMTDCYALDTHLLVGSIDTPVEAQGAETTSYVREYKAFDGVMIPTKITVLAGGQEQQVTITKVETNNVPASKFDLPTEIKALIK